ncbi:MAG: hypothetical protein QOG79_2480, partial [Mycobacterium sp.]|nr:hypothetical protein [Mycobacterium sp.]
MHTITRRIAATATLLAAPAL